MSRRPGASARSWVGSAALAITCALLCAVVKPAFGQPIKAAYANIANGSEGVSVAFERPATYTIRCEPLPLHPEAAACARGKKIQLPE